MTEYFKPNEERPEDIPEGWINYRNSGKWVPPEKEVEFDLFSRETVGKLSFNEILSAIERKGDTVLLHFKTDLTLSACMELTSLPEGLTVEGTLDLCRCQNLTILPKNLTVSEDLWADQCINLTTVSEGIDVGGEMRFDQCPNLTTLPKTLISNGDLRFMFCSSLKTLPEVVEVRGNLILNGCSALMDLPSSVTVEDSIFIKNCGFDTNWKVLRRVHALNSEGNIRKDVVHAALPKEIEDVASLFENPDDYPRAQKCREYFDIPTENMPAEMVDLAHTAVSICIETIQTQMKDILEKTKDEESAFEQISAMKQRYVVLLKMILPDELLAHLRKEYGGAMAFLDS